MSSERFRKSLKELGAGEYARVPVSFEVLEERARELGADHGRAAASWFFGGNTSRETYAAVLKGIEEGDPAVLDSFPGSPLSGEWADGMTMGRLLEAIGVGDPHAELSFNPEPWDGIADAYCDAFESAAVDAIELAARRHAWKDVGDDARYSLDGVAWRIVCESPDGETVEAIMVGDDARHTLARSDLTPIAREEYCGECGQVGCSRDGYPRVES